MKTDIWTAAGLSLANDRTVGPRYQRLAAFIGEAVRGGEFRAGERLPTVRELATRLGVSVTTVVNAYNALRGEGIIRGEVGRGTFVTGVEPEPVRAAEPPAELRGVLAWRRRALANAEHRLAATYPDAVDLMRGSADSAFLPVRAIKRAYASVARELTADDVQYPTRMDPDPELVETLLARFEADGVPAGPGEVMVGNSAIQFVFLMAEVLRRERPSTWPITVAVEEPGYQAAMDVLERAGCTLIGMSADEQGVRPRGLAAALEAGATLVVLTPRAGNPTGAGWTPQRRDDLARELAAHPAAWVIEDDYFADGAETAPGSLIADPSIATRVLHVRGFAKVLAPDLRLAAAVAKPELHAALTQTRMLTDGWTSRTSQRVLARVMAAPETHDLLARARAAYAERRAAAVAALDAGLGAVGGGVQHAREGLYCWITLPPGSDAGLVVESTARQGFLVAAGEPFFVRPGAGRHLRLNAGSATVPQVVAVSAAISRAALEIGTRTESRLTP